MGGGGGGGNPLDLSELHSLKSEIGNNRDQVFHFPLSGRKVEGFKFPETLSLVVGPSNNND